MFQAVASVVLTFICGMSSALAAGGITEEEYLAKNDQVLRSTLQRIAEPWIEHGGLELLTAGSSQKKSESTWGHTALRLVGSAETPMNDVTVEFYALMGHEEGLISKATKGFSGGFPLTLSTTPLFKLLQKYLYLETRGIKRLLIPTDAKFRRSLLAAIFKLQDNINAKKRGYYLLSDNCAGMIFELFQNAGWTLLPIPTPAFPKHVEAHLMRSLVTPWTSFPAFDPSELEIIEQTLITNRPLNEFATSSLQRFYILRGPYLTSAQRQALLQHVEDRTDQTPSNDIWMMNPLPNSRYQLDDPRPSIDSKHLLDSQTWQQWRNNTALFQNAVLSSLWTPRQCQDQATACAYFKRAHLILTETTSH